MSKEQYVKTGVAQTITGLGSQTLRDWADEGKIRVQKTTSGHRLFNLEDLLGLVNEHNLLTNVLKVYIGEEGLSLDQIVQAIKQVRISNSKEIN